MSSDSSFVFSRTARKKSHPDNQLFFMCSKEDAVNKWLNKSNRLVSGMPHSGGRFRSSSKASWTQLSELAGHSVNLPSFSNGHLCSPYLALVFLGNAWKHGHTFAELGNILPELLTFCFEVDCSCASGASCWQWELMMSCESWTLTESSQEVSCIFEYSSTLNGKFSISWR